MWKEPNLAWSCACIGGCIHEEPKQGGARRFSPSGKSRVVQLSVIQPSCHTSAAGGIDRLASCNKIKNKVQTARQGAESLEQGPDVKVSVTAPHLAFQEVRIDNDLSEDAVCRMQNAVSPNMPRGHR